MEKFSKILKCILGLIVVVVIVNTFIVGLPKFGKVVDSATKQPQGNILVSRIITVGSGGHGDPERLVRIDSVRTDGNGKFYLGPYIKFRFPFQHKKDLVNVNISLLSPERILYNWGGFENKNYFAEGYESGMASFYKATGRKIYFSISLVPIVSDEKQCHGDSKCIEENKRWTQICKGRYDLPACLDMIQSQAKLGGQDVTDNLALCNNERGDTEIIQCLRTFDSAANLGQKVIFTEASCSKIVSELGRNYCYLLIAAKSQSRMLCNKITDKLVPENLTGDLYYKQKTYRDECIMMLGR